MVRKVLDQKYSESNGLPKDEDTKLKKRRTFGREARYIYHQRPRSSRVSYVFRILVVTTRVTPRPHAKPARQTCLASENLPVRNMREACEMHVRDSKDPFLAANLLKVRNVDIILIIRGLIYILFAVYPTAINKK